MITYQHAAHITRTAVGVVIPVYMPAGVDPISGEALLRDTVAAFCQFVEDPAHVCLSVDGTQHGAVIATRLASELGATLCLADENRGKLQAAIRGAWELLTRYSLAYLAVVDQDGDHFANELPNLVRAAEHIAALTGTQRVLVLGQRTSRHHPMGWLRGELEELADRMLLDALDYYAAIRGEPLRLEFAGPCEEYPDFHSGYKLFSRATAEDVFLREPEYAGCSDECYYRHACEAVMTVEALVSGAVLGVVRRSTINEQPVSAFGLYNRQQLTADMIIWPCKRLGVPLHFVRQWLANHMPRLLLNTLSPAGKDELRQVTALVLAAFGAQASHEPVLQPLFL